MFETAITNLVEWWANEFFEVTTDGHLRNLTFEFVQSKLDDARRRDKLRKHSANSSSKGEGSTNGSEMDDVELDLKELQKLLSHEPEVIRSPNSLMKHALQRWGSRDVSAQLFTALCRALGIPSRLVVSLQSVPWQSNVGKPKPTYKKSPAKGVGKGKAKTKGGAKGKAKAKAEEEDEDEVDMDMGDVDIPSPLKVNNIKGKGKAKEAFLNGTPKKSEKARGKEKASSPAPAAIEMLKRKDKAQLSRGASPSSSSTGTSSRLGMLYFMGDLFIVSNLRILSDSPKPPAHSDPLTTPPVFWTEVFSRPDGRWIPVDPIRALVNKRKAFDPSPVSAPAPAQPSSLVNHGLLPSRQSTPRPTSQPKIEDNRLLYVLAFEEDGFARDVTRRYAREFSAKVLKAQGGSNAALYGGGGQGRLAWWEGVVASVRRPYRLHRDDVEDEELDAAQYREGMPTTVSGFKDHPL
jgi:xeroderma pigmentosum group C-complementing protein